MATKETKAGAAATEAADDFAAEEAAPKNFSVQILSTIKSCQLQNGLRHGDHVRYRRYCARKLRRLRRALKFTHGRGRMYVERSLTPVDIMETRCLLIPLMNAERAWAHAMELKEESGDNSRARFMKLRRFKKATMWSRKLLELCGECADTRTSLEAEAYAAYMAGGECMERDGWEAALGNFATAAKIYGQLGNALISDAGQEELFLERVRKANKTMEYCKHMTKRQQGTADLQSLKSGVGDMSGELQAKLNSVLADARKKQASNLQHLDWRGYKIAVRSEATRIAILEAKDKTKQRLALDDEAKTAGTADSKSREFKMSLCLEVFSACDDALQAVRAEKAAAKQGALQSEKAMEELALLSAYIRELKLRENIEHKLMLIDDLALRLEQQRKCKAESIQTAKGGQAKKVKPADLVRMYDTLLQNVADLKGLPEPAEEEEDEEEDKELPALELTFRFLRCFYLAQSYQAHAKWREAFALFERGTELAEAAQKRLADARGAGESRLIQVLTSRTEQIEQMGELIRGAKIRCHAKAIVAASIRSERPDADTAELPLLLQRLATIDLAKTRSSVDGALPYRVAAVPPDYQAVACKPCLFDVAFTSLLRPSLLHRLTAKQKQVATTRREHLVQEERAQEEEEKQEAASGPDGAAAGGWFNVGGWFN